MGGGRYPRIQWSTRRGPQLAMKLARYWGGQGRVHDKYWRHKSDLCVIFKTKIKQIYRAEHSIHRLICAPLFCAYETLKRNFHIARGDGTGFCKWEFNLWLSIWTSTLFNVDSRQKYRCPRRSVYTTQLAGRGGGGCSGLRWVANEKVQSYGYLPSFKTGICSLEHVLNAVWGHLCHL